MKPGDLVTLKDGRRGTVTSFRYPVRAWMDDGRLAMERESKMPIVGVDFGGEEPEWIQWGDIVGQKKNGLLILIGAISAGALLVLGLYILRVLSYR